MLLKKLYAGIVTVLVVVNYLCMGLNMAMYADDVNELTANTITVLFFAHTLIKLLYFAVTSKNFYR